MDVMAKVVVRLEGQLEEREQELAQVRLQNQRQAAILTELCDALEIGPERNSEKLKQRVEGLVTRIRELEREREVQLPVPLE